MSRLRWKKQPRETGLRAIGAGPRPSEYHDGQTVYAMVYAHSTRHSGKHGWYWVARADDVPLMNTANREIATEDEAKREAAEYVNRHLSAQRAAEGDA